MNIIETENLTKFYGKSRGIIDVNIEIEKGEIFGFIGPNGAGKSTTIRTLLAFIMPLRGTAKIFGKDTIRESSEIKKRIGYLPDEVNYYDNMRALDLLMYSARLHKKDCSKRIRELSDIFSLDLKKKISSLSSGNKRKVGIIQALLHEPELLILDEATVGLDPLMKNTFFDILKEENKKGVTIFFSSHILGDVQKICDRVGIIKDGRIIKIEYINNLKENKYKKIKVEFSKKAPKAIDFKTEGIVNIKLKDNTLEFYYSGKINNITQELSKMDISDVWIEDPDLEEVFMHYYEKEEK
jgi:ABC-2 type transport system ATP-binding protein